MKNKTYDDILLKLQTTMYDMSIKDLEIYLMALSDYVEQRKLCDLMCGGVEDDLIPSDWDEHNMKTIAQSIPRMIYNDCIKEEKETVDMIENFGKFSGKISMDIVRKILTTIE